VKTKIDVADKNIGRTEKNNNASSQIVSLSSSLIPSFEFLSNSHPNPCKVQTLFLKNLKLILILCGNKPRGHSITYYTLLTPKVKLIYFLSIFCQDCINSSFKIDHFLLTCIVSPINFRGHAITYPA
jgi:hypothetical protein